LKINIRQIALILIIAVAGSTALAAAPALPSSLTETDAGAVSIVKGSGINLVSRESSLPVAVTNTLAGEVRVIVNLKSSSAKLVVEDSTMQLVIPAGTTVNAQFPIRAIGSGNVVLVSWLTALSGRELGQRVQINLTVNPDIETAAIVLFLSFVVVLIVIGVIRTLRRRKAS
jgi:ATP-dependent protease HslVU (ClpYQ) peptidase subunit